MFKYIKIMLFYRKELDQLIKKQREEFERLKREEKKYNLNLCKKHQQERNFSHYSEKNCHYCQLQKELELCKQERGEV
jgi:hypothetical protein